MTTTPDLSRAPWRKSSHSGGNGGDCIEVAPTRRDVVAVRDSKDPSGPVLLFPGEAWRSFVSAIAAGDLPPA
jgi:hypothetical protein